MVREVRAIEFVLYFLQNENNNAIWLAADVRYFTIVLLSTNSSLCVAIFMAPRNF
jgi:phosphoribosyl-ATP pyrophosphohydrolase